jgi:enamine deaminase RidA (YjgF/YER057c/UK114 family)
MRRVRRKDVWKLFSPPLKDWAAVHGEFFGSIRPANTIMQVVCFIDPDWLVEIEADAIVES